MVLDAEQEGVVEAGVATEPERPAVVSLAPGDGAVAAVDPAPPVSSDRSEPDVGWDGALGPADVEGLVVRAQHHADDLGVAGEPAECGRGERVTGQQLGGGGQPGSPAEPLSSPECGGRTGSPVEGGVSGGAAWWVAARNSSRGVRTTRCGRTRLRVGGTPSSSARRARWVRASAARCGGVRSSSADRSVRVSASSAVRSSAPDSGSSRPAADHMPSSVCARLKRRWARRSSESAAAGRGASAAVRRRRCRPSALGSRIPAAVTMADSVSGRSGSGSVWIAAAMSCAWSAVMAPVASAAAVTGRAGSRRASSTRRWASEWLTPVAARSQAAVERCPSAAKAPDRSTASSRDRIAASSRERASTSSATSSIAAGSSAGSTPRPSRACRSCTTAARTPGRGPRSSVGGAGADWSGRISQSVSAISSPLIPGGGVDVRRSASSTPPSVEVIDPSSRAA